MAQWKIYYNPKCSKCREALSLLQARGIKPEVVEYIKTSPTAAELRELITKLGGLTPAFVRTKEELYQELGFDVTSVDVVVENLVKHPQLLERPIVVKDKVAVICRPVENIEKLF